MYPSDISLEGHIITQNSRWVLQGVYDTAILADFILQTGRYSEYRNGHKTCLKAKRKRKQMDEDDFEFLPKSLRNKLLPFQRKGVQYAIGKQGR